MLFDKPDEVKTQMSRQKGDDNKLREKHTSTASWTGVRLPDTTTDQAHKQLSRSYVFAYADSSSNGII